MAAPRIGHVEGGYVFIGGDPKDPKRWVPQSQTIPQDEPSTLASVGRGMMDVGQGIKQLALGITDPPAAKEYTKQVEDEISGYERGVKGLDLGRIGGNIAATLPFGLVGGGGPAASILRAGASGALAGGSQFVPEGGSRAANATVGGILGAGLQAIPAGYTALKNAAKPSATMRAASETARKLGVKPTPAQSSGSRTLQRFEAGMENTAGGGLAMEQLANSNQRAVQKEIAKRLGVDADLIDRSVLDKALTKIEGAYKSALGNKTILPDDQFVDDLAKITENFNPPGAELSENVLKRINDPKLLSPFSAKDYNSARSLIGRDAVSAFRAGDANKGHALEALQDAMDELAKRNLPKSDAVKLEGARKGFQILKTVEKAVDPKSGTVSGPKLASAIKQKDPRAYLFGRGDNPLLDVADASSFLRQSPDSFTAARLGMMGLPSILGAGYGGYQGGAEGAAKGAVIGTALPYMIAKGYLGASAPQSILGSAAGTGLRYSIPALGGLFAQP